MLELRDNGEGREDALAGVSGADDALRSNYVDGREQALKREGVLAVTALKRQTCGVLEADRVRDLAFQRRDFLRLIRG